ncbi:hypothetical protein IPL68_00200 [Candidatus Saccharibacteria bacterium]|nr:MAG: hypothetical protein IPL68_00200 [Candidatus Saccharibacteria bacterium]
MLSSQQKLLVLVLAIASAIAIGLQVPTLSLQKSKASDEQKSQDISSLSYEIKSYNSNEGELPTRLTELQKLDDEVKNRLDDYRYEPSEDSFKLCATFKTDTAPDKSELKSSSYSSSYIDSSRHKKGNVCFTYEVYSYGSRFDYPSSSNYQYDNYSSSDSVSSNSTSVQYKSNDNERQTDINILRSHLEAYYAQYGNYPTLVQVNNETWRATNMKGLDAESLSDPENQTNQILADRPIAKRYSYAPKTKGNVRCVVETECNSYVVTATLSDGDEYSQSSY